MKLLVIKVSDRIVQNGQTISNWVCSRLEQYSNTFTQSAQTPLTITRLNLADLNLETADIEFLPRQGIYTSDEVKAFSQLVKDHHALVLVVPEYNGTYPAILKNAFDHIANELVGKFCVIVGYAASSADLVVSQVNHTLFYMGAITVSKAQINLKDLGFEVKRGLATEIYKLEDHPDYNLKLNFALDQLFRFKEFLEQEQPVDLCLDQN